MVAAGIGFLTGRGSYAKFVVSAFGIWRTSHVCPAACPLSGVKQTSLTALAMSAYDPKRTSSRNSTSR
jgi:hypothetical protein